jgi:hypothetical protein
MLLAWVRKSPLVAEVLLSEFVPDPTVWSRTHHGQFFSHRFEQNSRTWHRQVLETLAADQKDPRLSDALRGAVDAASTMRSGPQVRFTP